jgi:hypothetical protein
VAAIPYACGVVGSIGAGWVTDKLMAGGFSPINSRKLPIIVGLVAMAVFTFVAAETPSNGPAGSISFFLCGSAVLWLGAEIATVPRSFPCLQINHPKAPPGLNRAIWLVLSRPNVCCLLRDGAQTDVILWLRKARYWSGRTKGCY